MKLKLNLFFYNWDDFKNRVLHAETGNFSSNYKMLLKTVTVEIPDGIDLTKTQYQKAQYLSKLSEAQKQVEKKRNELYEAEEIVKNMLAIEHQPD